MSGGRGAPVAARRHPEAPPATPPVGPVWFPVTMGTGILASLLQFHASSAPFLHQIAVVVLALAWLVTLGLIAGLGLRVARDPRGAFLEPLREPGGVPPWGSVAMGLLALGTATLTVVPAVELRAGDAADRVALTLWLLGTTLGLVTSLAFSARLIRGDAGDPAPTWALAVVPPMVSATSGADLVPAFTSSSAQLLLLVASAGCFFLALGVSGPIFLVIYKGLWGDAPLALGVATTAWIPAGIVGQATAAAQAMGKGSASLLRGDLGTFVQHLASGFGVAVIVLGAPLVVYAAVMTVRGFGARMPFHPGWWALTFPVGTLALGASLLGDATGWWGPTVLGWVALATLVGTWTLCSTATLAAVRPR